MKKQKTYAVVCLVSLLLFFTSPILFISGVVFDTLTNVNVEAVDLIDGESESENETPMPLEEESHATAFKIEHVFGGEAREAANDIYMHSDWKSVPCTTITPPPDQV